jgi:hypothetical protein
MKNRSILFLFTLLLLSNLKAQLLTYKCKQYFLNGPNIAWNNYGWDFGDNAYGWGGGNGYNAAWWENTFTQVQNYGGNSVRVWVHCKGEHNPLFSSGTCTGLNNNFFNNMDDMLNRARNHNLMVIICLWDFHVTDVGRQDVMKDLAKTNAYINNALIPMVQRYANQCNLLAWEIFNEPEWIMSGAPGAGNYGGAPVTVTEMQRFVGLCAAAVHNNSDKLVTVGSACLRYNSDVSPANVNYWKDASLIAASGGNPKAYLDFYQIHYYDWMLQSGNNWAPYNRPLSYWNLDKPVLIGESGNTGFYTYQQQFDLGYANGYCGTMIWAHTSGGAASWGQFNNQMLNFRNAHPNIVDFTCGSGACCTNANLGPDVWLCEGVTSTTLNSNAGSTTNKTYTWYRNGSVIAGATSPTYGPTSTPGTYVVVVDSMSGLCVRRDTVLVRDDCASLTYPCNTPSDGQNLVVNGDFEAGSVGFTSGYTQHCLCPAPGCSGRDVEGTGYSNAGEYCVGSDVHRDFHCCLPADQPFNVIPTNFTDHTPGAGNRALLVDGACTAGVPVWSQTVTVQPNTNYYFTAWVTSLYTSGNYADLRFMINGVQQGTAITGPANSSTWLSYTHVWSSGATGGNITISIINNNTNCAAGNDFAIDDIAFTAGCAYGAPGPVPNINGGAATATLCGSGGSVTLNSGVTGATKEFMWKKDGVLISGANSATYNATVPGVYQVCTRETSPPSCYRSDEITVTNDYTVNLGANTTLCDPPTLTLDAVHAGTGVTYVWKRNGTVISGATSRTYMVNQAGTYVVEVTDPGCGLRTDDIVVSSTLSATPNDAYFCTTPSSVNLSVTGSGTYNWYSVPTGGSILAGGSNTSTYTTPMISASTTYYVEDATLQVYNNVGPDNNNDGYVSGGVDRRNDTYASSPPAYIEFQTFQNNLVIQQMDVTAYCEGAPCNGSIKIAFYNTSGTLVTESAPIPMNISTGWSCVQTTVNVNVTLATAGVYRVSIKDISPANLKFCANRYLNPPCNFGAYNVPGVIQFIHAQIESSSHCGWPYLYNWKIGAAGSGCGRVAVRAIQDCPLPVNLVSFNAVKINSDALITWSTSSEKQNAYFVVQRSYDGINFEDIHIIPGNGTSSATHNYHYLDNNPNGMVSYRLKQVDIDGKYSFTNVVVLDMRKASFSFDVYPVPANEMLNVELHTGENSQIDIVVNDMLGKEVYYYSNTFEAGANTHIINARHLAKGVYLLKITLEDGKSFVRKVAFE